MLINYKLNELQKSLRNIDFSGFIFFSVTEA